MGTYGLYFSVVTHIVTHVWKSNSMTIEWGFHRMFWWGFAMIHQQQLGKWWELHGYEMDIKIINWLLNPIKFPFQETTGRHGRPWSTSTRPMPWTASGRTPWRGSPSARWSWERCNVPSKAPNGGGNGRISRKKGDQLIHDIYIIIYIYVYLYTYIYK